MMTIYYIENWEYDSYGNMLSHERYKIDGFSVQDNYFLSTYEYDSSGRLDREDDKNNKIITEYTYDPS